MANEDERRGRQWHLEKTVSLSHIISTLVIAGSVVGVVMKFDNRMTIIENEQKHMQEDSARRSSEAKDTYREIKEYLIRIEGKVDNKVDRK